MVCSHISVDNLKRKCSEGKPECSLCFENNLLSYCHLCNEFFCSAKHSEIHQVKTYHLQMLEMDLCEDKLNITCPECNSYNESVSDDIKNVIKSAIKDPETLPVCSHFTESDIPDKIIEKDTCLDCDKKNNLWICFICGNIGCGRSQYDGTGGNNHAVSHFSSTGHSMSCKIGTIHKQKGDVYCYRCDGFVSQSIESLKRFGIDIDKESPTEKTKKEQEIDLNSSIKFNSFLKNELSIKSENNEISRIGNIGNSCYISVVLIAIYNSLKYNDFQIEQHYLNCYSNPSECLLCQMNKIFIGLGKKDGKTLYPYGFVRSLSLICPRFSTGKQEDVCDFFLSLLSSLEFTLCEWVGHFTITTKESTNSILTISLEEKDKNSLIMLLNAESIYRNKLIRDPDILTIQINRVCYDKEKGVYKNMDSIDVEDTLNICDLIHREVESSSSGITSKKVKEDDNSIEDSSYLYDLNSFVVHKGDSSVFGHYAVCVKREGRWYMMNDESVFNLEDGDVLNLKKEAVLCVYLRR